MFPLNRLLISFILFYETFTDFNLGEVNAFNVVILFLLKFSICKYFNFPSSKKFVLLISHEFASRYNKELNSFIEVISFNLLFSSKLIYSK